MNSSFPLIPAAAVQLGKDAPIIRAIEIINATEALIALVTDSAGKMVGSVTDGDVRRGLLKGCTLQSPVSEVMHTGPFVMPAGSARQHIIDGMLSAAVKQMPLLNPDGTLVGIAVYDMLTGFMRQPRSNPVVIMAGGKGKRLLPLTQDIPKPMVEMGGKPMLEHILQQFITQGFSDFYICLNYLGHIIEEHFGDGSRWDCDIRYVREPEPLGTAGALSLIKEPIAEPFILINGDIMTSVDFGGVLDYHMASGAEATVCARAHRVEVPYGVIQMKDGMMEAIAEKPVYEDLVSAGIYVLNPALLRAIPRGKAADMPAVLQRVVQEQGKVAVFPMYDDRENWLDVGRLGDLEQAKRNLADKPS